LSRSEDLAAFDKGVPVFAVMSLPTLRIIPSEEEASLHPRAIWNHWKKGVIWDHRTYYGVLEFIGVCCLIFGITDIRRAFMGVFILCCVAPLHWYGNQRNSTHILTRVTVHVAILTVLLTFLLLFNVLSLFDGGYVCGYDCGSERLQALQAVDTLMWLAVPALMAALFALYSSSRNPPKDPILAELPSPMDVEDDRPGWASANVADGIEDDSLEPEGQVRLT